MNITTDETELFKTIEKELLDSQDDATFLKKDQLLLRVTFKMNEGTVAIRDGSDVIADLQFKHVKLFCEMRPRFVV